MSVSSCVQLMTPFVISTLPLFTSNALPLPDVPVRAIVFPPRSIVIAVSAPTFGSTRSVSVTLPSSRTVQPFVAAATASASVA